MPKLVSVVPASFSLSMPGPKIMEGFCAIANRVSITARSAWVWKTIPSTFSKTRLKIGRSRIGSSCAAGCKMVLVFAASIPATVG